MARSMAKQVFLRLVLVVCACGWPLAAAQAGLGGVGAPGQANNGAVAAKPMAQSASAEPIPAPNAQVQKILADAEGDVPSSKPVMIIRFNQRNVYFQKPLKKVVVAAEQAKNGAMYVVESVVPGKDGAPKSRVVQQENDEHVRAVMGLMNHYGVPSARMTTRSSQEATIKDPEVRIFVK